MPKKVLFAAIFIGGAFRRRAFDPAIADKGQWYGCVRRSLHQDYSLPKNLRHLLYRQRRHGRLPAGRSPASSRLAKVMRLVRAPA